VAAAVVSGPGTAIVSCGATGEAGRGDNVHLRRWSGAYLDGLRCSMSDSGSRRHVSLWRQSRIPGVSRDAADMMLASPTLPGQSSSRKDRELS